jgi:hypothetical protein
VCCHLHLQAKAEEKEDAAATKRLLQGMTQSTSKIAAFLTPTYVHGAYAAPCPLVDELAGAVGKAMNQRLKAHHRAIG